VNPIKVEKANLLETLKTNRDAHRAVVEEAWEGYKNESIRQLEAQLARAKKGDRKQIFVSLTMPQDHTDDYDRAIAMLELDVEPYVMLDEHDFTSYVQDDWGWKQQWTQTNSAYAASLLQ